MAVFSFDFHWGVWISLHFQSLPLGLFAGLLLLAGKVQHLSSHELPCLPLLAYSSLGGHGNSSVNFRVKNPFSTDPDWITMQIDHAKIITQRLLNDISKSIASCAVVCPALSRKGHLAEDWEGAVAAVCSILYWHEEIEAITYESLCFSKRRINAIY